MVPASFRNGESAAAAITRWFVMAATVSIVDMLRSHI
jgi:hypothetical protein